MFFHLEPAGAFILQVFHGLVIRLSFDHFGFVIVLAACVGLRAHEVAPGSLPVPSSKSPSPVSGAPPSWLEIFRAFGPGVSVSVDEKEVRVESSGIPDHPMMVGIRAWQQQVPLPQRYRGRNAWVLPRIPQPAAEPLSAKEHFFRGAIAIAANGVPIFNPIKNDGRTDTFLAGELDEYGGHSGRADDYHYHVAPLHLQTKVGVGRPIAVALDGYPILGPTEPDGSRPTGLDAFNGHETPTLGYHYHASPRYPYVNGGFHGLVTERGGQVDPQPRAVAVRPALPPLRGARISGFHRPADGQFVLTYQVGEETRRVSYASLGDGGARFEWVDGSGRTNVMVYPASGAGGKSSEPGPRKASGQTGNQRAAAPTEVRQPWIRAHFVELDSDHDGILIRAELDAALDAAFRGFDREGDGRLSPEEHGGKPPSAALAGFIGQHSQEIDSDGDRVLLRPEVDAVVTRMFRKMDADGDGRVTVEESSRTDEPGPRGRQLRGRPGRGEGR